jgi:hypothetical protein
MIIIYPHTAADSTVEAYASAPQSYDFAARSKVMDKTEQRFQIFSKTQFHF